jgi:uncharacterized protein DUF3750
MKIPPALANQARRHGNIFFAARPGAPRLFAARTVRWRGIFAVHTWIAVKERSASRYSRYDYSAWGEPIRVDGFAASGRWFGALPETSIGR